VVTRMCLDTNGRCLGMRGTITEEMVAKREISVIENGMPFPKAIVLMGFLAQRDRMVLDIPTP